MRCGKFGGTGAGFWAQRWDTYREGSFTRIISAMSILYCRSRQNCTIPSDTSFACLYVLLLPGVVA